MRLDAQLLFVAFGWIAPDDLNLERTRHDRIGGGDCMIMACTSRDAAPSQLTVRECGCRDNCNIIS